MNILQAKADYHTIYCYGGKGLEEVVSFVRERKGEKSSIVATMDIVNNIDEKEFLATTHKTIAKNFFSDPEKFISLVKSKNADFIIYSISANTVLQYRKVFNNPRVINFLEKKFLQKKIGSYTIWFRE